MVIPDKQEFKCFVDQTSMTVEIDGFDVMFKMNDENCVLIKDSEQVLLLRDMLTVWLSRQKKPEKLSIHSTNDGLDAMREPTQHCSMCFSADCNGECMENL